MIGCLQSHLEGRLGHGDRLLKKQLSRVSVGQGSGCLDAALSAHRHHDAGHCVC